MTRKSVRKTKKLWKQAALLTQWARKHAEEDRLAANFEAALTQPTWERYVMCRSHFLSSRLYQKGTQVEVLFRVYPPVELGDIVVRPVGYEFPTQVDPKRWFFPWFPGERHRAKAAPGFPQAWPIRAF